jgi:hypothetical protein
VTEFQDFVVGLAFYDEGLVCTIQLPNRVAR